MKNLIVLFLLVQRAVAFELITGSFMLGAAITYYFSSTPIAKTGREYASSVSCLTGLNYMECCGDKWIKKDVKGLTYDLKQHVFGQHIVQEIIPSAIAASFSKANPTKPLVMSFHGWPGGGKNYVTSFIVKNYFKKGVDSQFYHYFNGRVDFPLAQKVPLYQEYLQNVILSNVTVCPNSIFVFDEVDKMPSGVLDGIKPFLDHHENFRGVDFRRAIFIFLSNTGGNIITERYLQLWRKSGKTREQMTLHDFDDVINRGTFNEQGGLHMSDIIDHNLIDHYVPFLPLEKVHVVQCIKAEMDRHHFGHNQDIIDEVMKVVVFGPKPEALFSNSGCKRLSQKVSALIQQSNYKWNNLKITHEF